MFWKMNVLKKLWSGLGRPRHVPPISKHFENFLAAPEHGAAQLFPQFSRPCPFLWITNPVDENGGPGIEPIPGHAAAPARPGASPEPTAAPATARRPQAFSKPPPPTPARPRLAHVHPRRKEMTPFGYGGNLPLTPILRIGEGTYAYDW